jgi:hypothetical protein
VRPAENSQRVSEGPFTNAGGFELESIRIYNKYIDKENRGSTHIDNVSATWTSDNETKPVSSASRQVQATGKGGTRGARLAMRARGAGSAGRIRAGRVRGPCPCSCPFRGLVRVLAPDRVPAHADRAPSPALGRGGGGPGWRSVPMGAYMGRSTGQGRGRVERGLGVREYLRSVGIALWIRLGRGLARVGLAIGLAVRWLWGL